MNIHLVDRPSSHYFNYKSGEDKMNIHLAGIEADLNMGVQYRSKHKNFLITFEHFARAKTPVGQEKMINNMLKYYTEDEKILLDSGAFSKFNGVVDFSLQDYINFLHKWRHKFFAYVTLDIPLGNIKDKSVILQSCKDTEENLRILESEGLTPIPVYQRKWQRLDILEKYLEKYEYICIGGTILNFHQKEEKEIYLYLDTVFEMNSKYKKKLHGLGQTTDRILKEYPFYSVDSTTWKITSAMGSIISIEDMVKHKSIYLNKQSFEKKLLEKDLYDELDKSHQYFRNIENARFFNYYERVLTELWKERGVEYNEYSRDRHFSNQII